MLAELPVLLRRHGAFRQRRGARLPAGGAAGLAPGGHAFLHHSNDMRWRGGDFRQHPHWRNTLSLGLMRHYAVKEGLEVVRQAPLDWQHDGSDIDGLTLLRAP